MKTLVKISTTMVFFAILGLGSFFGYREYKDHQFTELLEIKRDYLCGEARSKLLAMRGVKEVLGDCRFKPQKTASGGYAVAVSIQVRAAADGAAPETDKTRRAIRCVLINPDDRWSCDH